MSEVDENRELSGLARSIDALFSGSSPAAAPESEASEATHGPRADEPLGSPSGSDWLLAPGPGPTSEPEPASTGEAEPVPEWEPLASPSPGDGLSALDDADNGNAPVDGATAPEGSGEGSPAPSAPDPDDLARAVDAFLTGASGAGAEVRALAEDLRGRLVLDPVADAVERLVREAGTPPDPTLLDMASAIIDPAVASRIVQRIGHERDEDRKARYLVLCRRLGEIMAKAFRGALTGATEPAVRRAYYDALIAMGDTCRHIVEEMVEDENTLLVRSGVAILGEMGGDGATPLVTSALAHPDARVRREALLALAKLGDEESGALVLGSLEDPEREVRVAAATAAGALKVDRALRPLLQLLETEGEGEDALPFIDALGKLGDPGAVPVIEKHAVPSLFSKRDIEERVAAYRALHEIGTPHARDLVQKALSDKDPAVRAAVRRIVGSAAAS